MDEKAQKILIIDDEVTSITILGNLLREDAYQIVVALDGKEALKMIHSTEPPDLILLDITMPGMDGYEVCRALQADEKTCDIPVIFVTAHNRVESESKGLALGAVDYISKPFKDEIVRARVQTHLYLKKQRDQLLAQQKELDRSHQRTLMILETVSEGIFDIDRKGNITFINPAALQMIGYEKMEEVLGRNSCSVMHHTKADGTKRSPSECLACQPIKTGQFLEAHQDIYWRQDQTFFPVSVSSAPAIRNGEIQGAVVVFRDITLSQQLEQELYRVDKTKAFQVVAGGIAHDFNNLLSVILGNLQLASMEEKTDSKVNKYLLACEEAAMLAADLAAKFHTIAKTGKSFTSRIDIKKAVQQTLDSLPACEGIDCEVIVPSEVWPLDADEVEFLQLLKNIISNAREAMADGGKITIRIQNCPDGAQEYATLGKDKYLLLAIEDQGSGIPEELMKKIFDPYFSTKDRGRQKGMGLGLSICNAIMQRHLGAIELLPGTEQGTIVHLYFPVMDEGEPHTL